MSKKDPITIKTQMDFDNLIREIKCNHKFAGDFIFEYVNFDDFFSELEISYDEFIEKRYYFNKERNLHISWSRYDAKKCCLWISTYGLISSDSGEVLFDNKFANPLYSQRVVVKLILDEAKRLINNNDTYDTTGFFYGKLCEVGHALYHNILFFFELVGKCYLYYAKKDVPKIHKLSKILDTVKLTIFEKHHNDSLFHLGVLYELQKIVEHLKSLPNEYREEFVKYNDNNFDTTILIFNLDSMKLIEGIIDLSCDCVFMFGVENSCLEQGMYNKLIKKAKNDKERKEREKFYKFLIEE